MFLLRRKERISDSEPVFYNLTVLQIHGKERCRSSIRQGVFSLPSSVSCLRQTRHFLQVIINAHRSQFRGQWFGPFAHGDEQSFLYIELAEQLSEPLNIRAHARRGGL